MRKQHRIVIGVRRGIVFVPDECADVRLNPMEITIYRLFLAHPEGIPAGSLIDHWEELRTVYEHESKYDSKQLMDSVIDSICAESKTVFYSNISRIKKKFVDVLGRRKASPYIIKREKDGLYRIRARV
ncbi:MAG: hypothetical protein IKX71_00245 [Bacteroidales bacterium]|nr:hypothetical protein [Bacteroidales bacterium]